MRVVLNPSTGVRLHVWREEQLFHATRENTVEMPQICLGVDLFEVIAGLAGLDLERPTEAEEASRLAKAAQGRLAREEPRGQPPALQQEGREHAT